MIVLPVAVIVLGVLAQPLPVSYISYQESGPAPLCTWVIPEANVYIGGWSKDECRKMGIEILPGDIMGDTDLNGGIGYGPIFQK